MSDDCLGQILDELENEAACRFHKTREWQEAHEDTCRFWNALLAVIPKECRYLLNDYENAEGVLRALEGEYSKEAIYLYGIRKGIQIAGG